MTDGRSASDRAPAADPAGYEALGEPGLGVVISAADGGIRHVSRGVRAMLGREPDERMRRAGDVAVHSDDAPRVDHLHDRAAANRDAETAVIRLQHRDRHWLWAEVRLSSAVDPHDQAPVRVMTVAREVTDERRRLLAHVVAAHEEERTRIANDVHDDTVQTVAAVELKLGQLRRHLTEPRQMQVADELSAMVRGALERLRQLIFELQPPGLHRGGLAGAVGAFASEVFAEGATEVRVEGQLDPEPGPETSLVVYRILQEALRNVQRHAGAQTCWVRLRVVDAGVEATVDDDGVGFDAANHQPRPGHLGTTSMRERAELAGGWTRIVSRPDGGTSVTLWVPDRGAEGAAYLG